MLISKVINNNNNNNKIDIFWYYLNENDEYLDCLVTFVLQHYSKGINER